jgi:AAA domain
MMKAAPHRKGTFVPEYASCAAEDQDHTSGHTPKSRLFAHVRTGPQLANAKFAPKDFLIKGVIKHPSIGLLYADDGVGKTWVAMSLALAAAQGGHWLHPVMCAPKPRAVLYVDGEMTEEELQERFLQLNGGTLPDTLHILSLAAISDDLDLAQEKDWDELLKLITDFKVCSGVDIEFQVLDNWSTLVNEENENDNTAAKRIMKPATKLRQAGVSTLWIHHASSSGRQAGATARRRFLNYVFKMWNAGDRRAEDPVHCYIRMEKARNQAPIWSQATTTKNQASLEVELLPDDSGRLAWQRPQLKRLTSGQRKLLFAARDGTPFYKAVPNSEQRQKDVALLIEWGYLNPDGSITFAGKEVIESD